MACRHWCNLPYDSTLSLGQELHPPCEFLSNWLTTVWYILLELVLLCSTHWLGGRRQGQWNSVEFCMSQHCTIISCHASTLPSTRTLRYSSTESRWFSNATTRYFFVLPFRLTTLLSSMDTQYHTLNQQTLLQHCLSLHRSGIVAAATMEWLI